MILCESLKEKMIIIAESDAQLATAISRYLQRKGFVNRYVVSNGKTLYEVLRRYYDQPERVGLIIANEALPQCQLMDMCLMLSSNEGSAVIPFIILGTHSHFKYAEESREISAKCLLHYMPLPLNYAELLLVIGFQLTLKHERCLRHKHEERLITELAERKIVDAKLKYLVARDELTGLLNRQSFERSLRLIFNRHRNLAQKGALLFIDIDRFSLINELESFATGDRLLVDLVAVIRRLVTQEDVFARIGSDEFCLFLVDKTAAEVRLFAEKIRASVYEFNFFKGTACYTVSLSVGISLFSEDNAIDHPNKMISQARQACHMAKENGRNRVWVYHEDDTKVQERHQDLYWVPLIRTALLEKKFFLVFQPVVDLSSGEVSYYEVLIRMHGEGEEVFSPADFIPVAERTGLIHCIDLWVVEKAIDLLADLPDLSNIALSINLSGMAFQDDALFPLLKDKLDENWVKGSRITFEITETAAVDNFVQTRDMITKIRALGCKFSLDDFGAGFCSFNYLKSFPVDYVKIDGQFIRNLVGDETDQVLVRSMVEIATNLGKKTIAECVESPATIRMLREIGVHMGQGYIFGKPQVNLAVDSTALVQQAGHIELSWLNRAKQNSEFD